MKHDRAKKPKGDDRDKRRAIERALDAVAKGARRHAEQRIRERCPELFGADRENPETPPPANEPEREEPGP